MKPTNHLVLGGFMIANCLISLMQDIMGPEAYNCKDHWIYSGITIPLALIGFIFTLWYIKWAKDELK